MVHYGPLAGAAQSLQQTALDTGEQQPLNYMRSNGAALLVAASDVVDQQHHLQQQLQMQQQSAGKAAVGRNHFFCDQCNMVFGSKSAHTSHMKSHMKFAAQQATAAAAGDLNPVDGQEGSSVGPFNGGAMTGSGNGGDPYQCDKCNKTFAVPARLVSKVLNISKGGEVVCVGVD